MKKLLISVFMMFLSVCLVQATSFNLTHPNGGESLNVDDNITITWNDGGLSENVRLKLYKGGASFGPIVSSTTNDGSYGWTIPASLNGHAIVAGSDYTMRLETVSEGDSDVSGSFTINPAVSVSLTLTAPNGPENWKIGTQYKIKWNLIGSSENIRLKLYKGGSSFGPIISSTTDDGEHPWTIPTSLNGNAITPDSDYKVRVETVSESHSDYSNSDFDISPASSGTGPSGPTLYSYKLYITSPKSTSKWRVGSTQAIKWKRMFLIKTKIKPQWVEMLKPRVEKEQMKVAKFKGILQLIKTVKIEYRRISCKTYPLKVKFILWKTLKSNAFDGKYGGTYNWPIPSNWKPGCYQIRVTENKTKGRRATSKTFLIRKLILKPGIFKKVAKKKL